MTAEAVPFAGRRVPHRRRRRPTGLAEQTVCSRVAIYRRISFDRHKDELGVGRQQELCQALVDNLGWTAVRVFTDNDRTASAKDGVAAHRPDYEKMMRLVRGGEIDAIVTYQQDRLLREPRELEDLIDIVEENAVEVRGVALGRIDLSTASGRMQARNMVNYSKFESELKGERMAASVEQHRKIGKWPNGLRPFGYQNGGVVHPEEAAVLKEVVRRVLNGEAVSAMAHELNERGYTTTRGKPWSTTALRILLTNPRLAGWTTHYGERVARGQWEPLWDDETYDALVARVAYRRQEPRPRSALLSRDMIQCARCHGPMMTGWRKRPRAQGKRAPKRETEGRVRLYVCPRLPEYRANGSCGRMVVDAEAVERIAWEAAQALLIDPKVQKRLRARQAADHGPLMKKIARMHEQVAGYEAALDDAEPDEINMLRGKRKRKLAQIAEAQKTLDAAKIADAMELIPKPGDAWPTDLAQRRRLIAMVIKHVTVKPGKPGVFDPSRVVPQEQPWVKGGAK